MQPNLILLAAARGARIQSQYHNWSNGGRDWREANLNSLGDARIHPDDAHLRYGPISTGFRKMAEAASQNMGLIVSDDYCNHWAVTQAYYHYTRCIDDLERSLLLLILAEAIADEGQ